VKQISVNAEREYKVNIGIDVAHEIKEISQKHSKVVIFSPLVLTAHMNAIARNIPNALLFTTLEGEEAKTLSAIDQAWKFLGKHGIGRGDAVIAVGGGSTTDSTGFVASTWLRGIEWYAFPTTLAGAVDASIGGKTGINSRHGKNLIGSFYSPSGVFIDINFLNTLKKRDLRAGMAEVIKTGFIRDPHIIELLNNNPEITTEDLDILSELITRSVAVNADVVSQDFREGKLREILNYGHTLGHAIEKAERYQMRHGEAVSLGLIFAGELSVRFASLPQESSDLHRSLLEKYHLPTQYSPKRFDELFELMIGDKKSRDGQVRFIGLSAIGETCWLEKLSREDLEQVYGQCFGGMKAEMRSQ
jgi:3-dehydroquinate synthase